MELLSPAGSMECLIAAVQNGADAVYFGGGNFNARRFADNFSGDALVYAVDYCHERGVRCYITLNTLLFDREIPFALDFAGELYRIGVDAVLVQDLGIARVLRRELPELTLHASTQMGIHELHGLEYCKHMGISRAVLAREVSLERIKFLAENSDVEIETFAHGALCMGFSGSCLYSSMSGERSGNRGTCAQPCRKRASVSGRPGADDFCLSTNDICMLSELNALKAAGVACVKIEGRMKKSEYVAAITRCYRAAIDGADAKEIEKLRSEAFEMFNRGEFSTSHLYGDSVKTDRIGSSKPSRELISRAEQSIKGERKRFWINFCLRLHVGEEAVLEAWFAERPDCTVECRGEVVQRANKPQTADTYTQRLMKLGDTPFVMKNCEVNMQSDCYISASELNALRRRVCDALLEKLHVRNEVPKLSVFSSDGSAKKYAAENDNNAKNVNEKYAAEKYAAKKDISKKDAAKLGIYARIRTVDEAGEALNVGADYVGIMPIYFNDAELAALKRLKSEYKESRLVLILPNVLITAECGSQVQRFIESSVFCGIETNNIGQWNLGRELPVRIAGIGMNILNSKAAEELFGLSFTHIMPSPELNAAQLAQLAEDCGETLIPSVHGRVPLMQLLHCPVKEHLGCKACSGSVGNVTDEAGREFPLINTRFGNECLVSMLNCKTTDLVDVYDKIPHCAGYALSFMGEASSAIGERICAFARSREGERIEKLWDSTRGHWNRKVD